MNQIVTPFDIYEREQYRTIRQFKRLLDVQSLNVGQVISTDGTQLIWGSGGSGGGTWGSITGTLSDQTDLQSALSSKFTLPSLTSGSVLFSDGSTIAQDNPNLFWDNTNNRLGIGTATPSAFLEVVQTSGTAGITLSSVGRNDFVLKESGSIILRFLTSSTTPYVDYANNLSFRYGTGAGSALVLTSAGLASFAPATVASTSGTVNGLNQTSTFAAAAGSANYRAVNINYTINNSGAQTGNTTGIFLNATETALNGMSHNLMDLQYGGATKFSIRRDGYLYSVGGISNQSAYTGAGNSAASSPIYTLTGTWFTGGTTTTTKPHFLIEPTGATSTNWNTNGTAIGVNAATGFTGNFLDLQLNAANILSVSQTGGNTTKIDAGSSRLLLNTNTGVLQFNDGNSTLAWTSTGLDANTKRYSGGNLLLTKNQVLSEPNIYSSGTWITGGTGTTNKPYVLIEPSGATSTNWSTSGTGLGVNAPSGFVGNIADFQINGTSIMAVSARGNVGIGTTSPNFKLDVGGTVATSLGGGTQSYVGGLSSNSDGTGHIQMYNSNAGSLSDFRFSVLNDTRDQYLSFAGTSNAYSTNLFGSARNTSMYIFSNSLGGTPRNLTIGTVHSRDLIFGTNNAEVMRLTSAGNVGIGTTAPTAVLHLKAGTASANTAPLKFTSGTNLATPEAGAMEYNNTPYFTNSDTIRRNIVLSDGTYTAGVVVVGGKVKVRIGGIDYNVLVE